LDENEVFAGVKQLGSWPPGKKNGLKGREPRTEAGKQLGILGRLVYSDAKAVSGEMCYMIFDRDYLYDFLACASKPVQTTKCRNQRQIEDKGSGKSQAPKVIQRQEKVRKGKTKPRWSWQEIETNPQEKEQVRSKRIRQPSNIIVEQVQSGL